MPVFVCVQDKYGLIFPWVIHLLEQLPPDTTPYKAVPQLQRPDTTKGWFGNMDKIKAYLGDKGAWKSSINGNEFDIGVADEFTHNISSASWLHGHTFARLWQEWNTADNPVIQTVSVIVTQVYQSALWRGCKVRRMEERDCSFVHPCWVQDMWHGGRRNSW